MANNILYVSTGAATKSEVTNVLTKCLPKGAKWTLQYVESFQGEPFGYAYLWTDASLCNLLVGCNADGTERAVYRPDEQWVCPKRVLTAEELMETDPTWIEFGEETAIIQKFCESYRSQVGEHQTWGDVDNSQPWNEMMNTLTERKMRLSSSETYRSWADIVEEKEEMDKKYQRPMIRTPLSSLITIDSIPMTVNHLPTALKLAKTESLTTGKEVSIPNIINLLFHRVDLHPVKEGYDAASLCAIWVPGWVTQNDISKIFMPYVSGRAPRVTMNKEMAFISFDRQTDDARYARLMCRKIIFKKGDKDCTLVFDHTRLSTNMKY